jgi:hypothetical protein
MRDEGKEDGDDHDIKSGATNQRGGRAPLAHIWQLLYDAAPGEFPPRGWSSLNSAVMEEMLLSLPLQLREGGRKNIRVRYRVFDVDLRA